MVKRHNRHLAGLWHACAGISQQGRLNARGWFVGIARVGGSKQPTGEQRVHLSMQARRILSPAARSIGQLPVKCAHAAHLWLYSPATSNAAKMGFRLGANGLVTVTPRQVNPSWRSSDRTKRQSASAAAASTTESQIVRP